MRFVDRQRYGVKGCTSASLGGRIRASLNGRAIASNICRALFERGYKNMAFGLSRGTFVGNISLEYKAAT
jgi:hypothetical protein